MVSLKSPEFNAQSTVNAGERVGRHLQNNLEFHLLDYPPGACEYDGAFLPGIRDRGSSLLLGAITRPGGLEHPRGAGKPAQKSPYGQHARTLSAVVAFPPDATKLMGARPLIGDVCLGGFSQRTQAGDNKNHGTIGDNSCNEVRAQTPGPRGSTPQKARNQRR